MADSIVICATNWLGDSVMSMPAVEGLRRRHADARIAVLAKPRVASLWSMQPAVDRVVELGVGSALFRTVREARGLAARRAYVLPLSFRSALAPFLAGVPERVGFRGHARAWMLTEARRLPAGSEGWHQSCECLHLMDLGSDGRKPPPPRLRVPEATAQACSARLSGRGAWLALMPGADRGPAKRWPAERFAQVGRMAVKARDCGVLVLGGAAEKEICAQVAAAVGSAAVNLAGETTLEQLAAFLDLCAVAVTNDSGGMHMAAAMGTRVVAVFGVTDPVKTGPLGEGHRIVTREGTRRSRDVGRESREAEEALGSIVPAEVWNAVESAWVSG